MTQTVNNRLEELFTVITNCNKSRQLFRLLCCTCTNKKMHSCELTIKTIHRILA